MTTAKAIRHPASSDQFPTLADVPAVKAARARLEELQLQARKLRERKAGLEQQVRSGGGEAKERAQAVWEGQPAKAVTKFDTTKLAEVTQELDAVAQAIDLAPKIIKEVEASASREFVKNPVLQETYRRTGDRVIASVIEFARAVQEERQFRERLDRDGVRTSLLQPVLPPNTMLPGRLDDTNSTTRIFLRMVQGYGFGLPELPELDGQKL